MRKFLIALLILALSGSAVFAATKNISVYQNMAKIVVDGKTISADNFIYNGTTYVPLRAISESLGKDVGWHAETSTVTITSNQTTEYHTQTASDLWNLYGIIELAKNKSDMAINIYRSPTLQNNSRIDSLVESIDNLIPLIDLKMETSYTSNPYINEKYTECIEYLAKMNVHLTLAKQTKDWEQYAYLELDNWLNIDNLRLEISDHMYNTLRAANQ